MPPYEEVGLGEMDWDAGLGAFTWECPCGDLFQITPVRPPPPGGTAVAEEGSG